MALKLEWTAFEDGSGAFACAGGLRLLACKDGRWSVIALGNVDVTSHAPTLAAAQEAAEAAAARMLAEDAGVRALLGLRWVPVAEARPPEGVEVEASNPCGQPRYIGTCVAGVWADTAGNEWPHTSHWRPLGAGPEVGRRWIPVGEALPQEYSPATWSSDLVLVRFRNGHMSSNAWAPSKYHALGVWVTAAGTMSAVDQGDHWCNP